MIGAMLAAVPSRWAWPVLRYAAVALAIFLFLFLFSLRRAERLETTEKVNDVQRQMLEAAARRPRDRDELAERLRDGTF